MNAGTIDLDRIRANKDALLALGDKVGGWTTKSDCRQTGVSIHFKFDKKVDVWTTMEFVKLVENGPGALVNALRLLLGEDQVVESDDVRVSDGPT